jgi:hypothetical protein
LVAKRKDHDRHYLRLPDVGNRKAVLFITRRANPMSKTESKSPLEISLAAIDAACKEKMEAKPCVGCKKITLLSLRSRWGHVPYCAKCFRAEMEQLHREHNEILENEHRREENAKRYARLPGEDDTAYRSRFWRWNRECIEELEREKQKKKSERK